MNLKWIKVLIIGSVMMQTVNKSLANNGWQFTSNKLDLNSGFSEKSKDSFVDDVLSDEISNIVLDASDLRLAKVWSISELDMKRYKALMSNKSGQYYKNKELSPLEILGINARDNTERSYFANLLVKSNSQRFAKELAFEKAYANAYKNYVTSQNLPVIRPFNTDKYSPFNYQALDLIAGDNLMLFIKTNDAARRFVSLILNELSGNKKITFNIYFMDKTVDKNAIFNWARRLNIPSELVNNKTITLNVGYQGFKQLNSEGVTPALYLIRGKETMLVDLSRF